MTPFEHQPKAETKDKNQEAMEALAERLRLREQYFSQVKVLCDSGILENFAATSEHPLPEQGVYGIDGKKHYLPNYEDILERLKDPEKREILEKKREQGFTKLLLVPFALPFSVLLDRYKQVLLGIHKKTGLKATDGSTLELNTEDPIYVWPDLIQGDNPDTPKEKRIEYQVKDYEGRTKEARGGRYKSELLNDPENAWPILLLEDNPDLPVQGQGQTIGGRKQLEANKTPKDYLKLMQEEPNHQNEQGLTPEANLTLWLTYLQERKTAIDDWQGSGKANWLVGTYISGDVPYFFWSRGGRQPSLDRNDPESRYENDGCRPAASV